MNDVFHSRDLHVISYERYQIRDEMIKAWTDSWIMACKEMLEKEIVPMTVVDERSGGPREDEWRGTFYEMLQEITAGVGVVADLGVCLGRKPDIG